MCTDNLWSAIQYRDAGGVQRAIQNGADVNSVNSYNYNSTPLTMACAAGEDYIVRILLDAGADARWYNSYHGMHTSAIVHACSIEHLSIVKLLLQHDKELLDFPDGHGVTPLFFAVRREQSEILQFFLDRGVNVHASDHDGNTALMHACQTNNLEIVQLLLAAGVDVHARDKKQRTALHYAVTSPSGETARELIFRHNANIFAVDKNGDTPLDWACRMERSNRTVVATDLLLEMLRRKMTAEHGRLALHDLLTVAKYSFAETRLFRPPQNPLRMFLPLGKLALPHLRTLLSTLDTELIRNRDDSGMLPIHIACQTNTSVDVLATLGEMDSATLQIADFSGALPIHLLCGSGAAAEFACVRYLVEQGGVGTLSARNHEGALPLHILCGSAHPPLRTILYLTHSFPGSVSMRTNGGDYPFMVAAAACETSSLVSLDLIYKLVRVNPDLVVPR